MNIAFSTLYSYLFLSFSYSEIVIGSLCLYENMLSTLQGMIWKEYYQAEILGCANHTCSVVVSSPGSIHMITWHKINNQRLQEKGSAVPIRPLSLVAELKNTYRKCKNQLWPGHSAVLCHWLRPCMTNPQMRLVTFRERCGPCQYAKQSECAWQIMKHTLWKLWTLSQCQSAAENLLLLEVMLAQICC